jgi:signal transduction histidine kinase/HAMP domain-containing protein/ActR/RegA family two-component response regulator
MKPHRLSTSPGLRAKLFVAFLIVALVPLGALAFLHEQTLRTMLTDDTYRSLHVAASQIAFRLDAAMQANLNAVRTEAQSPTLVNYLTLPADERRHSAEERAVADLLETLINKDPVNISTYALLDRDGINVIDTTESHIGWNESAADYYQEAVRTGQPYISHVRVSPEIVGTLGFYYSQAVRDDSGEIVGVLRARYYAASIQKLIAESTGVAGEASFAILLDENLIHLAHGTEPLLILRPIVPLDPYKVSALQMARRLPAGPLEEPPLQLYELQEGLRNADTAPYFSTPLTSPNEGIFAAAVAQVETQPWTVIVVQPEEVFLAPIRAQTQTPLIVAAVIALVVTGAAFAVGQYLVAPIVQLTSVVQAVEQGDLRTRAEVKTRDEIGQLATAFNSMADQMVGTLDALQQYVERLRALRAIDGAVLGARSLEDIARVALNHLQAILPETVAGIVTFDADIQEATIVAFSSEDGGPTSGTRIPTHPDFVEALQQGKVVRQQDIATKLLPPLAIDALQAAGVSSFVVIPLIATGKLIGVLAVGAKRAEGIAPEYIDVAREIADEVAVGLHQVQLREALSAEQRRLEALLVHLPEGILLLDSTQRIRLTNPAVEKALPLLTDTRMGDKLERLGDRPLAEILTSPPKGLWHEVKTDSRVFEVIARPINHGRQPESWVLVINDVTQQREIEGRIQQRERLASVGQLAAGIAHDFNNILTGIVMYAQMMSRTPELSPHNRERLSIIDQQARHAANLIQQILDFSRRAVIERKPLSLAPFLREQVRLLERTLPEDIKVELAYGTDDYVVEADPTRLQQAFMNLALNARDAMPQGGTLRIELKQIAVTRQTAPLPEMAATEWVYITFSDTGTGILPEVIPHIFEPFFTTKEPRAGGGVGLGLAQVHGIIGQHEGFIDVDSEAGRGTTFSIYLPALRSQAPQPPATESAAFVQGNGEIILVVEDNAPTRQALVETLEVLNYRVLAARNGQEALQVYKTAQDAKGGSGIDLVLTDIVMPEMGGISLVQQLRQQEPELRMLAITGHMLTQDLEELRSMGVADIIRKPVDIDTLAEAIRRALDAV